MNKSFLNVPRLSGLLIASFCLVVLVAAGMRTSAAWQYFAAESIASGFTTETAIRNAGLDAANKRVDLALALLPLNPDFLALNGYLQELQALQANTLRSEKRQLLQQAKVDYQGALATRPRWPYGWSQLLQVKEKLDEIDREFMLALQRAAETGSWEPGVQLVIIRTGLRRWDELNSHNRRLVTDALERSLRVQPRQAYELVRLYARPDLLCPMESDQPQIRHWCSQVFDPAKPADE